VENTRSQSFIRSSAELFSRIAAGRFELIRIYPEQTAIRHGSMQDLSGNQWFAASNRLVREKYDYFVSRITELRKDRWLKLGCAII
jgi:hypothetical protein